TLPERLTVEHAIDLPGSSPFSEGVHNLFYSIRGILQGAIGPDSAGGRELYDPAALPAFSVQTNVFRINVPQRLVDRRSGDRLPLPAALYEDLEGAFDPALLWNLGAETIDGSFVPAKCAQYVKNGSSLTL